LSGWQPRSPAQKVSRSRLLAVLVKLGEKGVPEEDIPKRLDSAADELIKLRAENDQLRRGPPALAAIAEDVQALIDKGEFDNARRALARGRQASRALRIDASRYEAAFLAQEARVDDLQLAYRAAAAKYAEAAGLVAPFDTEPQLRFLLPIAKRCRNSPTRARRSYGLRPRIISAMRSKRLASGRAGRRGSKRPS
jgi:hypothetical protein